MKNLNKKERDMEFIMTYLIALVALGIGVAGFILGTLNPFMYILLASFLSTERDVIEFFNKTRK